MSEVEETIERIKIQSGVEGYVISNRHGQVLRRFPTMPQELAELYATHMIALSAQAHGVIRDLNPKHEIKFLRIRTKSKEVMIAYDPQFIVIVIQRWISADKGL